MYVIGLTGNIATGKSTVAKMLGDLGAYVIDADKLAHQVMRAGTIVNRRVAARFGAEVCTPDGEINRKRLGALVFSDADALSDLDHIVHPAVIAETVRRLNVCSQTVCVIEAIKLLEADMHELCDVIWVVTSSRAQQIERLVRTRGLTVEQAELRIDAQPSVAEKVARADVVIDNSGELTETREQVLRAWNAIAETADQPRDDHLGRPFVGDGRSILVGRSRSRSVAWTDTLSCSGLHCFGRTMCLDHWMGIIATD